MCEKETLPGLFFTMSALDIDLLELCSASVILWERLAHFGVTLTMHGVMFLSMLACWGDPSDSLNWSPLLHTPGDVFEVVRGMPLTIVGCHLAF